MAKPPISAAIASLREHYVASGVQLSDLRFRMIIFEEGKFEIVRVDETGMVSYFRLEEGVSTIDDPACATPGVYYLRPDSLGKFHQEIAMADALLIVQNRIEREKITGHTIVPTDDGNTFKFTVRSKDREFFSLTFAKSPVLRAYSQANPLHVPTAP
ncbi:MAG: hypothetical protein WC663_00035 [Patescibacteria group bacterium]|jgi:hypothetical protein